MPFVWMVACQTALNTIKHAITNSPILIYPDASKEYHLFMDALNHTWSSVFTQQRCSSETNGNEEHTTLSHTKVVPFQLHNSSGNSCEGMLCNHDVIPQNSILPMRCRSCLKVRPCPT